MGRPALHDPVQFLRGVGPARAAEFAKLGVRTVKDLIEYAPFRYELIPKSIAIGSVRLGEVATLVGALKSVRQSGAPQNPIIKATVIDGTGQVRARWFNSAYLCDRLHPGDTVRLTGKMEVRNDTAAMTNPTITVLERDIVNTPADRDRLVPVYSATAELPTAKIAQTVAEVISQGLPPVDNVIPHDVQQRHGLLSRAQAIRLLHEPETEQQASRARRTLAFEELLVNQIAVHTARAGQQATEESTQVPVDSRVDRRIRRRFPFPLTAGQDKAVEEICADLSRTHPMNRLLQGDVGCGKTAVALYAALAVVAAGRQVVMLAPTEVLARQHQRKADAYLQGSRVRRAFLSGATPRSERAQLLKALRSGDVDILIGTHAILEPDVALRDLALVIVDEQQKFGVAQRAALRSKGTSPHRLILSATPIPRTLAMTLFGELDVSTIPDAPAGRAPVTTRVVTPDRSHTAWRFIRRRLDHQEQAYIVYPLVEESEKIASKAATAELQKLQVRELASYSIELLHGRMSAEQKSAAMRRFEDGEAQVLVSTTAVEVGVDVPRATLMVIQNAERFGLSQLHQLRGRVGRGTSASWCLLCTSASGGPSWERLQIVCGTNDGFRIAEEDLRMRGPGELIGTKQHGLPSFRVADLTTDLELLTQARDDAARILRKDPRLNGSAHRQLRHELSRHYADKLSWIDVA